MQAAMSNGTAQKSGSRMFDPLVYCCCIFMHVFFVFARSSAGSFCLSTFARDDIFLIVLAVRT
jgi:hypothetical protein